MLDDPSYSARAYASPPSFPLLTKNSLNREPDPRNGVQLFSKLLGSVLSPPALAGPIFEHVDTLGTSDDLENPSQYPPEHDLNPTRRSPSPTPTADYSIVEPLSSDEIRLANELFDLSIINSLDDVPLCAPRARIFGSPPRAARRAIPRLWNSIRARSPRGSVRSRKDRSRILADFDDLPLDGEEGELIDDEGCYVDAYSVFGLGILPIEISFQIFLLLDFSTIIACLLVSKNWHRLANDNLIWRELFHRCPGWRVNPNTAAQLINPRASLSSSLAGDFSALSLTPRDRRTSSLPSILRSSPLPASNLSSTTVPSNIPQSLCLDWRALYITRLELHRSWMAREPQARQLSGHSDSVYCLEFDSRKIVTGSRDKTIKIWSLRSGTVKATLKGHDGSVLCLKFDRSGFLVSGSSDRTIRVWDMNMCQERRVLRGHEGGVLDLRIDEQWIVSCSKDATIRVWSRKTLSLHCVLNGHDGPVNALGLQDGKIVSASGDGNMIMWDIATQTRIRTFEGHDRGLACIEFQGDIVVSGSNDCNIKVWRASSAECILTLSGHDSLVRALAYDPFSGLLISASYDRSIKLWDLRKGKLVRDFQDVHSSHIFDVKFDVSRIISSSHDERIVVLDFGNGLDITPFF